MSKYRLVGKESALVSKEYSIKVSSNRVLPGINTNINIYMLVGDISIETVGNWVLNIITLTI